MKRSAANDAHRSPNQPAGRSGAVRRKRSFEASGSVTRVRTSALTGTGSGASACHSIRCRSAGLPLLEVIDPDRQPAPGLPRHVHVLALLRMG